MFRWDSSFHIQYDLLLYRFRYFSKDFNDSGLFYDHSLYINNPVHNIADNFGLNLDVHAGTCARGVFNKPEGDIFPGVTNQIAGIDEKDLFMKDTPYNDLVKLGFSLQVDNLSKKFEDLDGLDG